MILFTKHNCSKCSWLKKEVDLDALGVTVHELTTENYDALGMLAFHEAVPLAEKSLPILVLDSGVKVTGAINIKRELEGM